MQQDKVKHVGRPAEPFAAHGSYGTITRTFTDGPLRITPAWRGIPAQAYVTWDSPIGPFHTWERLADLHFVAAKGKR